MSDPAPPGLGSARSSQVCFIKLNIKPLNYFKSDNTAIKIIVIILLGSCTSVSKTACRVRKRILHRNLSIPNNWRCNVIRGFDMMIPLTIIYSTAVINYRCTQPDRTYRGGAPETGAPGRNPPFARFGGEVALIAREPSNSNINY
jgi:hypothetical protein